MKKCISKKNCKMYYGALRNEYYFKCGEEYDYDRSGSYYYVLVGDNNISFSDENFNYMFEDIIELRNDKLKEILG